MALCHNSHGKKEWLSLLSPIKMDNLFRRYLGSHYQLKTSHTLSFLPPVIHLRPCPFCDLQKVEKNVNKENIQFKKGRDKETQSRSSSSSFCSTSNTMHFHWLTGSFQSACLANRSSIFLLANHFFRPLRGTGSRSPLSLHHFK